MELSEVNTAGKKLVCAKAKEVDALEKDLWITFPRGYREYVTTLGEGVLGGSYVRIYPPWRIAKELSEWRRRIAKYWFWDKGRKTLPKSRALECIIIGDTVDGDELVFHPQRPEIFVLPRHKENIFVAGTDLLSGVGWLCSSGKLTKAFSERNFEPFDSRVEPKEKRDLKTVNDPEGESIDDIVELAKNWAKRHAARQKAVEKMAMEIKPNTTTKLIYEAFVLEGQYPFEPGYLIKYGVEDQASKLEIGTFTCFINNPHSTGFEYSPNNANLEKLGKKK